MSPVLSAPSFSKPQHQYSAQSHPSPSQASQPRFGMTVPVDSLSRKFVSALKTLDQPHFISSLEGIVKYGLVGGSLAYTGYQVAKAKPEDRVKQGIQTGFVAGGAALGSLVAFYGLLKSPDTHDARAVADEVLTILKEAGEHNPTIEKLIEKTKTGILGPSGLHKLRQGLAEITVKLPEEIRTKFKLKDAESLFSKIIPTADISPPGSPMDAFRGLVNLIKETARAPFKGKFDLEAIKGGKEESIFGEIGELSLSGLLPIIGGVTGGILGKVLTHEPNLKQKVKDELNESFFQFFANIVLCNIGAATFLLGLEKIPLFKSIKEIPWVRLGAMTAGILSFGVVGGSGIANYAANNFVSPMLEEGPVKATQDLVKKIKEQGFKSTFKGLYDNRIPGPADVVLHVDDFATVGYLAGLGWVSPIIPLLYWFSAKRSGEGYRTAEHPNQNERNQNRLQKNNNFKNNGLPSQRLMQENVSSSAISQTFPQQLRKEPLPFNTVPNLALLTPVLSPITPNTTQSGSMPLTPQWQPAPFSATVPSRPPATVVTTASHLATTTQTTASIITPPMAQPPITANTTV